MVNPSEPVGIKPVGEVSKCPLLWLFLALSFEFDKPASTFGCEGNVVRRVVPDRDALEEEVVAAPAAGFSPSAGGATIFSSSFKGTRPLSEPPALLIFLVLAA